MRRLLIRTQGPALCTLATHLILRTIRIGRIKLIDFGSSAQFECTAVGAKRHVTDFGGSQNYMSPERHFDEGAEVSHMLASVR